jgi:hypothetical protein
VATRELGEHPQLLPACGRWLAVRNASRMFEHKCTGDTHQSSHTKVSVGGSPPDHSTLSRVHCQLQCESARHHASRKGSSVHTGKYHCQSAQRA